MNSVYVQGAGHGLLASGTTKGRWDGIKYIGKHITYAKFSKHRNDGQLK